MPLFLTDHKPLKQKNKNLNKLAKANFTYDYEKDHYIYPNNVIPPYKNTYDVKDKERKVYYTSECKNCS